MKKIISCMIVLAVLALSGMVHAGERAGAFSISPYVGGYQFDEDQPLRRNRVVTGVRLGYDWTDNWETDLVGSYVNAELPGDTHRPAWSYRLDFLYNFMPHTTFVPFFAIGAGGESIEYPKSMGGDVTDPTFDVGAGFKYFFTDSVALRADLRHLWDFSEDKGLPTTNSDNFSNWEYSLGVSFLFGGEKAAVAAVQAPVAEPVKEAPLEPVPAAEPAPGHYKYCVTLNIQYDIDRDIIRPEYRDEVAKVGDFMKKYPTTSAVIEGHTDNVGTYNYNMELSQRRAQSVVDFLVDNFGIERARLAAKGYGFSRPVADNATNEGRQKNRRIEAIIDCAFDMQAIKPEERLCISLVVDFDSGKADVKPEYRPEIAKVADYLKQYPTTTAVIEGHTDSTGTPEHNLKLSQQRAENVVTYLVDNFGIDRSRLSAKGYGATRRVSYNNTPEGRQKNRRINAVIDCVVK